MRGSRGEAVRRRRQNEWRAGRAARTSLEGWRREAAASACSLGVRGGEAEQGVQRLTVAGRRSAGGRGAASQVWRHVGVAVGGENEGMRQPATTRAQLKQISQIKPPAGAAAPAARQQTAAAASAAPGQAAAASRGRTGARALLSVERAQSRCHAGEQKHRRQPRPFRNRSCNSACAMLRREEFDVSTTTRSTENRPISTVVALLASSV